MTKNELAKKAAVIVVDAVATKLIRDKVQSMSNSEGTAGIVVTAGSSIAGMIIAGYAQKHTDALVDKAFVWWNKNAAVTSIK
jgi:6-phosphogluconolactonase/glucosamine-6-phosphate isomerase/deaminase